jgi:hypothetical protein
LDEIDSNSFAFVLIPPIQVDAFRASWSEMGNKVIIIIPKNYHDDVKKMNKTVEVIIQDIEN